MMIGERRIFGQSGIIQVDKLTHTNCFKDTR